MMCSTSRSETYYSEFTAFAGVPQITYNVPLLRSTPDVHEYPDNVPGYHRQGGLRRPAASQAIYRWVPQNNIRAAAFRIYSHLRCRGGSAVAVR